MSTEEYDFDYYEDWDPEECWHQDYDVDLLEGRATCYDCGESWWMTNEEIARCLEFQSDYDEWIEKQGRPLNRFKEWLSNQFARLRQIGSRSVVDDDDIPF